MGNKEEDVEVSDRGKEGRLVTAFDHPVAVGDSTRMLWSWGWFVG